jgi:predicted RNA binding protein YcfA (HicA-like mRNA interferase family)
VSQWPATKARRVLAALLSIGWQIKREVGSSHRRLSRRGWPDYTFAFHGDEQIGPAMMARIGKKTGLRPEDL